MKDDVVRKHTQAKAARYRHMVCAHRDSYPLMCEDTVCP